MKHQYVLFVSSLFILGACGKAKDNNGLSPEKPTVIINRPVIEEETDVTLVSDLKPMNTNLNSLKVGSITIDKQKDTIEATVRIQKSTPSTWHKQAIYNGSRCPELKDDLNKDAYVDIDEAMKVVGKILIPLDADIDSQLGGWNSFPVSTTEGGYDWSRSASFTRLLDDLKADDERANDEIMKIGKKDKLKLSGKVVMIQGTADTTFLPMTVARQGEHTPHVSLPVACGILGKK